MEAFRRSSVVVVFDLHDFVVRGEGPAEPLDLAFTCRIKGGLQLDVERPRAHPTAVHRAENLNVGRGQRPGPSEKGNANSSIAWGGRGRRDRLFKFVAEADRVGVGTVNWRDDAVTA